MEENILIKKIVIHILDNNLQFPVTSEQEFSLNDDIEEYIKKQLVKIFKDDNLKEASFIGDENKASNICKKLKDQEDFLNLTIDLSNHLFSIMVKNVEIPSADLLFCIFDLNDKNYLAILKLNYRNSYIHFVDNTSGGRVNLILKQKTTLPSESQKLEECAIIDLSNFTIKLIEKAYLINGEKQFYFSKMFLGCSSKISVNEEVKIFDKATEKFNKKYFEDDFNKTLAVKKAIVESIEESETINIPEIAQTVFGNNPQLKEEYISEIKKVGLKDNIPVTEKIYNKKFRTQKITTDTGIEINLPVDYYSDKSKIEFINNPDGTVSILIKNVFSF